MRFHPYERRRLRSNLLKIQRACIISGWNNPLELQMAHIIPKIIGYNIGYEGTDSVNNCVLLSSGLHSLLDNFKWTLDIFSILDQPEHPKRSKRLKRTHDESEQDEEEYFKVGMIIKHIPKTGQSSLSGCHGQRYDIPIRYFASFYAHHYVYMRMNYTVDAKPLDCFKKCVESPIWSTLKGLSKLSEVKEFLLAQRQTNQNSDMDLIVGHTTDTTSVNIYLVSRYLWSWNKLVCILEQNVSEHLLSQYQEYLDDLNDLEWTPD